MCRKNVKGKCPQIDKTLKNLVCVLTVKCRVFSWLKAMYMLMQMFLGAHFLVLEKT